jgi:hypothetical protein
MKVYDLINEKINEIVKDKVNYFWEYGLGNFPVLEVFASIDDNEIELIQDKIERRIRYFGFTKSQVELNIENYSDKYRIFVVMDFKDLETDDILIMATILERYGNTNYF